MRKLFRSLLPALLSVAFAPAPLPRPDAGKEDLKELQGTWLPVEEARAGRPRRVAEDWRVAIAGDRMTFLQGGVARVVYAIALDAGKRPKAIDMRAAGEGTFRGIYALKGDTLIVCTGTVSDLDRPKALVPTGPLQRREVYQRAKR